MESEQDKLVDFIHNKYSNHLNNQQLSGVKESLAQLIKDASTIRNFPITHEDGPTPLFSLSPNCDNNNHMKIDA